MLFSKIVPSFEWNYYSKYIVINFSLVTGLPHTQGTQGIQGNSDNYQV